jgi:hypothetical protein
VRWVAPNDLKMNHRVAHSGPPHTSRGLPGFEGRSSVRTWLFRIATHAALDAAERRSRRELPIGHGPSLPRGALRRAAARGALGRAVPTGSTTSPMGGPRPKGATSSVRVSSLPLSLRCKNCRPSSEPCLSFGR